MQPDSIEDSYIDAWFMDDSEEDQRLPHKYALQQFALALRYVEAFTSYIYLLRSLLSVRDYAYVIMRRRLGSCAQIGD